MSREMLSLSIVTNCEFTDALQIPKVAMVCGAVD